MADGPDLSDTEIDEICGGLRQNAAKIRYLRSLGLTVRVKPNGRALVSRAHYEKVTSGGTEAATAATAGPAWSVHA